MRIVKTCIAVILALATGLAVIAPAASAAGPLSEAAGAASSPAGAVISAAAGLSSETTEPESAAAGLNTLGLFLGVGVNANGTPDFALDRVPTRVEAVTMLVRLIGKEAEALSRTWAIPFTDVPDWAGRYVGYAYANGLTFGVSESIFGSDRGVTAAEYITFVLRALGYASGEDFEWDSAWTLSDELGFTDGRYGTGNGATPFLRADVAVISLNALKVCHNGSDTTLYSSLLEAGVFTISAARASGLGAAAEESAAEAAPANTATPGATEFERAVFILINLERERQGLNSLLWEPRLMNVARAYSEDMEQRRFFSHTNPEGQGLGARMQANNIVFSYAGENLARGYRTPESVVAAWMASASHRRAILSARATHMGVGVYNFYWTVNLVEFRTPR